MWRVCEGFVKEHQRRSTLYVYTCFWPTKNHSNIHNRCVSCSLSGHAAMKDLENQTFTPVMKPRSGPTLPWMVENRRVHTQTTDFQQIRRIVWRRECFFREIITYKGPEWGGDVHMIQTQIEHLHKLENCPTPCLRSLERNAGDVKHHAEICGATSPGLFLQKSRTCSDKAGTCFAKAGACSAKQRTCGSTISNYACPLVKYFPQTPLEGWYFPHQWNLQRVEQSPRRGIQRYRNLFV